MSLRLSTFALLLGATVLSAQGVQFGIHAGPSVASTSVTGESAGSVFGGVHLKVPIRKKVALNFYVEGTSYDGHEWVVVDNGNTVDLARLEQHTRLTTIGVDGEYHFRGNVARGFYVGGGLALQFLHKTIDMPAGYQGWGNTSRDLTRLGFRAKGGYDFSRHLGVFLALNAFSDSHVDSEQSSSQSWVNASDRVGVTGQAGLAFRF